MTKDSEKICESLRSGAGGRPGYIELLASRPPPSTTDTQYMRDFSGMRLFDR